MSRHSPALSLLLLLLVLGVDVRRIQLDLLLLHGLQEILSIPGILKEHLYVVTISCFKLSLLYTVDLHLSQTAPADIPSWRLSHGRWKSHSLAWSRMGRGLTSSYRSRCRLLNTTNVRSTWVPLTRENEVEVFEVGPLFLDTFGFDILPEGAILDQGILFSSEKFHIFCNISLGEYLVQVH